MDILNWNNCNEIYEILYTASEGNLDSEGLQLLDESINALKTASEKLNELGNYLAKNQSKRYQERQRENHNDERQRENHNDERQESTRLEIYMRISDAKLTRDKVEAFLNSIGVMEYAINNLETRGKITSGIVILSDNESYVKILKERCTFKIGKKTVHISPNMRKRWN